MVDSVLKLLGDSPSEKLGTSTHCPFRFKANEVIKAVEALLDERLKVPHMSCFPIMHIR